jgi:hypothetical protein
MNKSPQSNNTKPANNSKQGRSEKMTPAMELKNHLHTYLIQLITKHIVEESKEDFTPEFELRFTGSVDGSYSNKPQPLTKDDYYNVLKVFKSFDPTISSSASPAGEYLLRIYPFHNGRPSPFRCEITGLKDIQKYCVTQDWRDCTSARFVRKVQMFNEGKPVEDVYMDSYAIKASYKREISYIGHQIDTEPQLKEIAKNWNRVDKTFRHMNRVSFHVGDGGTIKMDASIVKSSNQDDRGRFIPVRDIHQSNVFKNFEKYEIELELDNENVLTKSNEFKSTLPYLKALYREVHDAIRMVIVGIQQSLYPINKSEMVTALEDYYRVVHNIPFEEDLSNMKLDLTSPKNFVGPSSVALTFENLYPNNVTKAYVPFIKQKFTVTEKADGVRCLLFVSQRNGSVYLIDMNMKVTFTGLVCSSKSQESVGGLIVDGEYITKDKNGNPISRFMAFDIYFKEGRSYRDYGLICLLLPNQKIESRYAHLIDAINAINEDVANNSKRPIPANAVTLGIKRYHTINELQYEDEFHLPPHTTLADACNKVLSMSYEYNIDGLIFTSALSAVGASWDDQYTPGPLTKNRWVGSIKWKPAEYNTNDFLVTTVKTNTNEDRVTDLIEPYTNAAGAVQMVQYKTLELRCGFSPKKSGYLDAFTRILSVQKIEEMRDEYRDARHYMPTLFYPTDFPDRYSHISHVLLEPDETGSMQMITEEGEMIDDDTIVEFRYEKTNEDGFKWVPLRVRADKTHEYRKGLKSYGNDYETANGNWKSIMNPITREMLTTGVIPPYDDVKITNDAYYTQKSAGDRDLLQKYHNLVKEKLIVQHVHSGQTIIDLACGKAGDLWKWEKSGASFVFGMDYSRDNIENRFDGAAARYMNYYRDRTGKDRILPADLIRCIFATGDASKNIRKGDALLNELNKDVANAVMGIGGGARDSLIGNLYGIGSKGFDVCSCQFAVHYFFRNASTLEGFMTNVCQNVKVGGIFIGTCFDGKHLFNSLKVHNGMRSIVTEQTGEEYWKCVAKYKETAMEDDASCLGYEIDVYQKSIGMVHSEYLVNFDYMNRVMENYGFKLLEFESFYSYMSRLKDYEVDKYEPLFSSNESLLIMLNRTFAYQKVNDVDPTLVFLDREPILEKEREVLAEEKEKENIDKPEENEAPTPVQVPVQAQVPTNPQPKTSTTANKPAKEAKTRKCKETEELYEDKCLKKCTEDEFRNPVTKRCNKTKKNK